MVTLRIGSTILLCWYKLDGITKRNSPLSSKVSGINICFWDLVEPEAADSCCFVTCFKAGSCGFLLFRHLLLGSGRARSMDSCYFDICFWVLVELEAVDSYCFDICFLVLVELEAADSCCFDIDVCLGESELTDSYAEVCL
ncbi:hypothetical protein RhiirC2_793594 [Rhizophagus irregularis]|uniref:Uncharacterized protein n=1 Tax=Rhizophagus irregularis TaxID=588596 RepID=A0A2N1MF27_9GLOM|nr:hypothetical protein RhiirC2_793594 [Rhizophagus irregularis]